MLPSLRRHHTDIVLAVRIVAKFRDSRNSLKLFLHSVQTANNSGSADPDGVRKCEEVVSNAVIVEEADDEDLYFAGLLTSNDAEGNGFSWKFREFQTGRLAVHTDVPGGLVDMVRMAKR